MGYQRLVVLALSLGITVGGIFYFKGRAGSSNPILHICTWSNYYPENIIQDFTKSTGIPVELSYISSNEELFAKLRAGATGYDIIQPSDYMVRQMARLGMLQSIDHKSLSHLRHLDEYYFGVSYDPGLKFSIPFTWGTTGIAINTKRVKVPSDGVSWAILLNSPDPKHTSLLDDMREVFSAVFALKGLSINTLDALAYQDAKAQIAKVKDQILMFSSEPRPLLLKGELTIAHTYSTDGIQAHIDDPNIQYFIPKEGGVLWTDNFSIPTSSAHSREAHLFIDYFLNPDNALKIIEENHLATPNKTAKNRLPVARRNDPNFYPPPDVMRRLKFLEDLGDTLSTANQAWTELKS